LILNGPVLAEDRDIGVNAVVRYRLLGARVDLFSIDSLTGQKFSTDVMGYVQGLTLTPANPPNAGGFHPRWVNTVTCHFGMLKNCSLVKKHLT